MKNEKEGVVWMVKKELCIGLCGIGDDGGLECLQQRSR